jgi:hypothetical protein
LTARAPTGWKKSPTNNTKPDQVRNGTIHFPTQIGGIPEHAGDALLLRIKQHLPAGRGDFRPAVRRGLPEGPEGEVKSRYVLDMSTLK